MTHRSRIAPPLLAVPRFIAVALVAAGAMLAACGQAPRDPEARLRAWVAEAEAEVENRDRRGLMTRIAEGYADSRGHDRRAIDGMVRYFLLRYESLSLLTRIEEVRIFGDTAAEIGLTVGMAGTGGGFDLSANAYRFELELEKQDSDWLLIGARWGRLGGELR